MDGVGSVDSYIWRCAKNVWLFLSIPLVFLSLDSFLSNFLFTSLSQFSIKKGDSFIIIFIIFIITGFVGLV